MSRNPIEIGHTLNAFPVRAHPAIRPESSASMSGARSPAEIVIERRVVILERNLIELDGAVGVGKNFADLERRIGRQRAAGGERSHP